MTGAQITFVAAAFIVLFTITAAVQWKWLRDGRTKSVLVFSSGVAIVLSLRIAQLPPSWFSGSTTGFALAVSLLLGGFISHGAEARSFAFPLLTGMGLTLLASNAFQRLII